MASKNLKTNLEPQNDQSGFITMIVIMVAIIGVVVYFAYKRVSEQ